MTAEVPEPAGSRAQAAATVEELVRSKLSEALGGGRGILESAVPTIAFTITWLVSKDMRLSLGLSVGLTVLLLLVRVVQRSNPQFVINALFGIGIGAFFAYRASQSGGSEEDVARAVFTPGILYNGGYAVVIIASILLGWPVLGFLIGSLTGDATAWRQDRALVRLCSQLSWVLVAPCLIRVLVQGPLWLDHQIALLGITKIVLGWPLQVGAFAVMAWMLSRNRTPVEGDSAL